MKRLTRRRRLPLAISLALVAGAAAAPAALSVTSDGQCPPPALSVSLGGATTLASGLTLQGGTVSWGSQHVPIHVVTADLTKGGFSARTYAQKISSAVTVSNAVIAAKAVLGINGDFFHITSDGVHLVADGPVSTSGGIVKGWSKEEPAFVIDGSTARVDWVHLAGTVTIVEPHDSSSDAVTESAHLSVAAQKAAAKKKAADKKAAAKKAAAKKKAASKKKSKKKKKKKAVKHRRGVHPGPNRIATVTETTTTPVSGSTTTVTHPAPVDPGVDVITTPVGDPPPSGADPTPVPGSTDTPSPTGPTATYKTWRVTLDGLNDDATTGPTLFNDAWGPADRSLEEPSSARELDLSGGKVTRNTTTIGASAPATGSTALVVAGSAASTLGAVPVGSTVTTTYAMVGQDGQRIGQLIGGNAVLVSGGSVQDFQCTLEGDNVYRPRLSVGANAAQNKIIVAVSDGDGSVAGLTLRMNAELMLRLGASQAINLDAGNSTQLIRRSGSTVTQVNTNSQNPPRTVSDSLLFVPDS